MGYTKIVQYGNITEIYEYEKNIDTHRRKKRVSALTRKRAKKSKQDRLTRGVYERTKRSIQRSRGNFFRMCHHNVCNADTVTFLTITFAYDLTLKTASRHAARFMERIKKTQKSPFSYISVPELQKSGRIHFHLLVFNLHAKIVKNERSTRNLQRQFQRGYIDVMLADHVTSGIAGYLAKYMGKALTTSKNEVTRGYTCSRNVLKTRNASGNSLSLYTDIFTTIGTVQQSKYDVPFMGTCRYKKIIK